MTGKDPKNITSILVGRKIFFEPRPYPDVPGSEICMPLSVVVEI